MKIIAVVGTGSGCGKTTVACRILRAIPGLGAESLLDDIRIFLAGSGKQ